jgi:hypothetical protein
MPPTPSLIGPQSAPTLAHVTAAQVAPPVPVLLLEELAPEPLAELAPEPLAELAPGAPLAELPLSAPPVPEGEEEVPVLVAPASTTVCPQP